jgi:hypothetical protein
MLDVIGFYTFYEYFSSIKLYYVWPDVGSMYVCILI